MVEGAGDREGADQKVEVWKTTWNEFEKEYKKSLAGKEELLKSLAEEAKRSTITLLCVERDEARCHRSLLKLAIGRYMK